jgi:hypothetical protein
MRLHEQEQPPISLAIEPEQDTECRAGALGRWRPFESGEYVTVKLINIREPTTHGSGANIEDES